MTESKPTWDASLGYQVTPDNLVYVRAATGFRQGGANNSVTAKQLGVVIPDTFGPDTVHELRVGREDRLVPAPPHAQWRRVLDAVEQHAGSRTGTPAASSASSTTPQGGKSTARDSSSPRARSTVSMSLSRSRAWTPGLTANQPDDGGPVGDDGNRIPKTPKWASAATPTIGCRSSCSPPTSRCGPTSRTSASRTPSYNSTFDNDLPIGDYFMMNVSANFDYQNWQFRMFVDNVTRPLSRTRYLRAGSGPAAEDHCGAALGRGPGYLALPLGFGRR